MGSGMAVVAGRMQRAFRPRRGMVLLDNLFGIALVAVGVGLIVGMGLYARSAFQEQRAALLLSQLVQAVTATYQSTRNYGSNTDLIGTLDGFGRLPEDFVLRVGGNVTLEHPFGGAVRVRGGPGGTSNRFRIEFRDLDDDICAALAEKNAGKSRGRTGLVQVRVNSTALALPYTVAQAEAACNGGNASNRIDWDYY